MRSTSKKKRAAEQALPIKGEQAWRGELWSYMLRNLPVQVTISLSGEYFNLRDSANTCLYADDLAREDFDSVISEWARFLPPEEAARFRDEFSLQSLERRATRGRQSFTTLWHPALPSLNALRIRTRLSTPARDLLQFTFDQPST